MTLIHNERTKLLANSIDRISTACIAVGVLGRALSLPPQYGFWANLISPIAWILAAIALHLMARRLLGRLRP